MKKMHEPPLTATFWPHAFLQMLVFVGYMLALEPLGIFPSVSARLGELEAATGWGLPFVLWLVFVFLVVETCTRLCQGWAARVFPFHKMGFIILSIALAAPMLWMVFVGFECVLSFVALGRYPVYFGPIFFEQGFLLTLQNDLPLLSIFLLGEGLRFLLYGGWIGKWHHERGLRLLPTPEDEEA
jgi:hypothetical protein